MVTLRVTYPKMVMTEFHHNNAISINPKMVMKIIGITTVFDDSQLLANYHRHFHAYPDDSVGLGNLLFFEF